MKLDVFYYNVTKITQVSTLPLHTEREDFSKQIQEEIMQDIHLYTCIFSEKVKNNSYEMGVV